DIIQAKDGPIDPTAAARLRGHVKSGQALLPVLEAELGGPLAVYVRMLTGLLRKAEIEISPRRAAVLLRNVLAVHISRLLQHTDADLGESAWLAVQHSLPHAAAGLKVSSLKLLGAHNEAWKTAQLKPDDPRRWLLL